MVAASTCGNAPMTLGIVVVAQAQSLSRFDTTFVRIVDQALGSPGFAVLAIATAFAVGAVHALAPGHGKAIAAAYLVGERGRPRDAVLLGAAVAVMHTASVLILGLGLQAVVSGSGGLPGFTEDVTPVLRVASGLLVVAVGIVLLVRRFRGSAGHDHDHTHRHDHAQASPPGTAPFSRRGLVVLGMAGGLLPSPSAFLVLVTTSFTGRLWFGLILLTVFSLGLASTLTLLGLAVVRGRTAILARIDSDRRRRVVAAAARAGAVAVLLGGVVMTIAGVLALPWGL